MLGHCVGDAVRRDGPDPVGPILEAAQEDRLGVDLQLHPELVPGHVHLARQGPPGGLGIVTHGCFPPFRLGARRAAPG